MASETANMTNSQAETFQLQTYVPWAEAPFSPDARSYLHHRCKLVFNPDSLVCFDAGSDTARIYHRPAGYDAFHTLFHSDVRAACAALNAGEYSNDCMTYYVNAHPQLLETECCGEGNLLRRADGFDAQFAFANEEDGDLERKGVWVLEGGRQNHERLLAGWEKGVDWVGQLRRAGAVWYDDCESLLFFFLPVINGL